MYQDVICLICKNEGKQLHGLVGKAHGYEKEIELAKHIFHEHKEAWKELTEANEKINTIFLEMKEKYGIRSLSTIQHYYKKIFGVVEGKPCQQNYL